MELKRHSIRGIKYNGEEICGGFAYYDADEVDAVLAEKDKEIEKLKADYSAEVEEVCVEKTNVDTLQQALKEKDAEIARLEADNDRLEILSRTHVEAICSMADHIIPNQAKEIRRLKRALYKACEEWFKNKACALKCFNLDARAKKFDNAVGKSRAMAEKFKEAK